MTNTRNDLKQVLRAVQSKVIAERSYLQHSLANLEDGDGSAEYDEMHTRMDDDVCGALIDLEGTIARILGDYR